MYSCREIREAQLIGSLEPDIEECVDTITTDIYNLVIDNPSRNFICYEPWSDMGSILRYNRKVQRRLIMLGFKVEMFDILRRSDYYPNHCGNYWPGVSWDVELPDLYTAD